MNIKFMQTLDPGTYKGLKAIAKEKGVTVQELMRAIIIPEWMAKHGAGSIKAVEKRTRRLVSRLVI